jgi:hypothetical protein
MSKRILTEEQMAGLLKNENVARCSAKSISYAKRFMISAVQKYNAGLGAAQIFQEAGFDLEIIGRDKPDDRLCRWRKIYEKRGLSGLNVETRGRGTGNGRGRPRSKGLTDSDKIKRMEIEIAYLKAENDFLAKLRAAKKR